MRGIREEVESGWEGKGGSEEKGRLDKMGLGVKGFILMEISYQMKQKLWMVVDSYHGNRNR